MTDTGSSVRATWVGAFLAFAAALVVYLGIGRVTGHDFVNYDDVYLVAAENPAIGKGLVGGLPELLNPAKSPQFMNAWLPLYYTSLGIDHAIGGGAPWVFHLHSVLLHALGAAMVVFIARRLHVGGFVAALAGVVFAVHPVATESVAWVASRKDVLSFVWMAAAAICYLDGVARRRPGLHLVGAACLVVSMLAKGTTLVLPLLLAVHALLLREDDAPTRQRLRPVVPYAIVAVLMTSLHLWIAAREGTAGGAEGASLGAIVVADLQVVWRYFAALALPFLQSVEHDVRADAVSAEQAVKGAALLVVWGVALAVTWKRSRGVAAALVAVPLALLPFNNVLPRTSVLFAERYSYVALLPMAIGLAWLLRPRSDGPARYLPAAIGAGLLGALCARRLPVWEDSVALWTDASAKAPQSALVQCQLADAWAMRARSATAEEAVTCTARSISAWRSAKDLATTELLHLRGEAGLATELLVTSGTSKDPAAAVHEAVANFESALARAERLDVKGITGQKVQILTNLAACREALGDSAKALDAWNRAVRLDEKSALAWNGVARMNLAAGQRKEAAAALAKSAAASPSDPAIARERAKIRLMAGDTGGAKHDLADAIAAHPGDVDLLLESARLDTMLMRPVDAETTLRKAMELRPHDASIRELLAASLLDQAQSQAARDDMPAARAAAEKARELVPASSAPEQVLGIVARRAGNLEEAAKYFRKARDLHPEGVRIREQLASVLVELAVQFLGERREALATILLEEAVQTRAAAIATPRARLDTGVSDWPPPGDDDRTTVARNAALKGLAYLGVGRPADALPELLIAETGTLDAAPRLRRAVLLLGVRCRFTLGRADEAIAAARELPTIDIPDDAEWTWRRHAEWANALVERGISRRTMRDPQAAEDLRAAREALDAAKAAGMPESRRRTRLGEILFAEEDFLGATKEFDEAERLDPANVEPLLDRAEVWRTQFLFEEDRTYLPAAERDLRRAADIAASDPRVLAKLGEILLLEQKPSEAFPWLQRAVLADPSQAAARRLLAELAIRAGRSHLEKAAGATAAKTQEELAEARAAADRAVALDPPAPDALGFLGDVLKAQGDWAGAAARYEQAVRLFPGSTAAVDALTKFHVDRGLFYLLYKKRAEAIADFRAALAMVKPTVDLQPARDRLHEIAVSAFGEAVDLDAAGKPAEAAERFALSIAAEPTPEAHFARAVVLTKAQQFEDALPAYDAALELSPNMLTAMLNRASLLLRLGRLDDAETAYRAWLAHAPADDPNRRAAERQIEWIERERRDLGTEAPK